MRAKMKDILIERKFNKTSPGQKAHKARVKGSYSTLKKKVRIIMRSIKT